VIETSQGLVNRLRVRCIKRKKKSAATGRKGNKNKKENVIKSL
jgi:hypothetical protein